MIKPNLNEFIVCRPLLTDPIFTKLITYLENTQNINLRNTLITELIEKAENLGLSGNLICSYTTYIMAQGNHIAAFMAERSNGQLGSSLHAAFKEDMHPMYYLLNLVPSQFLNTKILDNYQPTIRNTSPAFISLQTKLKASSSPEELADLFIDHYAVYGFGDIANYGAFRWDSENTLVGIQYFDPMKLDDLIGYDTQKNLLISNTEAFIAGKPANNALLVGARGTGKSSAVKALANTYFDQGLRLLEITKYQLIHLPKIMEALRLYNSKKFIIFLDDLSFEDFEVEYKYLKSAIEGGVESKPANVLIYATSNRRHLIKETWKDRGESNDEIHRNDTLNETISLSDRFGLTIHYLAPNQAEYLNIITALLKKHNISLDESIRAQALQWEMMHSGRSGRTAQQFVNYYLGILCK
ncbi:ATP-binding protein [Anaerosinus massiliensis]|uniref:ATP-binding protein n=1 Tax=Massilibacillus massiliensis TaxID=1806837 RepID=UPI000ACC5969|nr:ATP-binding protein [Massilibacillus massiliensis]